MSSINLSATARTGLSVLSNVAKDMAATQNRLVTGKAVNTPIDNATKFFTSAAMDSRAASLNSLMDNIGSAQTSIKAASEGIKGIQNLIKQAQSLGNQALTSANTKTNVSGSVQGLNNTDTLVAGLGVTTATTITVGDGTTTATLTIGGTSTVKSLVDTINGTSGLKVKASLSTDGRLQLDGTSNNSIVVGGTGSAGDLAKVGLVAGTTAGETNETRASLSRQFDAIRSEIDKMASDAGVNGVNLLKGDKISLALNETGTSKTDITGSDVTSANLGITATTGQFQSDSDITTSLDSLIAAGKSLEASSASFSSNSAIVDTRADFNSALADILKTGANDLVAADSNEEAANLLALQTRQQMATTSLSIMQSAETTALRLIS
jgi:flagellin-like hook-associated protein FlgL